MEKEIWMAVVMDGIKEGGYMKKICLFLSIITIVVTSCNKDIEENKFSIPSEVKTIYATIKNFDYEKSDFTRTSISIEDDGPHYAWAVTDTIGIFPTEGRQVEFFMASGAGSTSATFTGGGWGLKSTSTYSAYYPLIGKYYLDKTAIPVDYTGQVQDGNNSTTHLGAYDYLAAPASEVKNGTVAFNFDRLGCLVRLIITIPQPTTLSKITLVTNGEFTQKGTIDLTAENNSINSQITSKTFDVSLQNIQTTTEDEDVIIYFMLPPTDLSANSLKVQVTTNSEDIIEYKLLNRNFEAGKAYALTGSDIATYHVATAGTLSSMISDEEKYSITKIKISGNLNGDDIRFIREMAGSNHYGIKTEGILQSLDMTRVNIVEGGNYYYNYTSDSDKEYYYYTKNDVLGESMFEACASLISIKLPINIKSIEFGAFKDCSGLTHVTIPSSVSVIKSSAFKNCISITDIIIPNGVVDIWFNAFYGCHSLTSITIPSSMISIDSEAFDYCNGLKEFIVDKSNLNYTTVDGILYNKDITKMIICPYAYTSDNLVIPHTVTSLASFEFHSGLIGKVTIPGSVTEIPQKGFKNSKITEVVMEEGVEYINSEAFCGTNLIKVTMPSTIKSINNGAFRGNQSLIEIYYYGKPIYLYTDVFFDKSYDCKLYVQKSQKESFVNSSHWNYFFNKSNIIEMSN